ncbi:MAG: hypothetical protein CFE23_15105 [Flavobacterium sp. BFFFF1]|uniref:M56 family metallopeptidase n=1 Tax=Flavobacterium sp. BFFFF1 TaxID=2015557 RepID=UPI000BDD95A9|nr:M56 family metallopeptidase [Flavobacterium sp. BFFFF1]OYU79204.1 MAG: hypothetical protein CFE23_15105 [Flavobacterium sp. BFFFF1]
MIVNDTLEQAISWTLIHSLWQGILLAGFSGLIVLMTKRSTSSLRYNLLSALFVVFLITVALTFYYEFTPGSEAGVIHLPLVSRTINANFNTETVGDLSVFINFLNQNANTIAVFWMVIAVFKLLGIFNAFAKIYRIRNYSTFLPSAYWTDKVAALASQIKVSRPVVLLESALIKIPCVTGYFKPIILLPVGLLSSLPQDQIEAILLHELAHIRRKDYIINLLQHVAETLFFFNPSLLWLSSLIKDEREHCCDDIALDTIGNKTDFIHALISFEAYRNQILAVAFAGKKNQLLQRVKRIIYDDNKSLNSAEKTFLSVGLTLFTVLIIASADFQLGGRRSKVPQPNIHNRTATATDMDVQDPRTPVVVSSATLKKENTEPLGAEELQRELENHAIPVAGNNYGYPTVQTASVCTPEPAATPGPVNISKTTSVTTHTVNSKTSTAHTLDSEVTSYDSDNPKKRWHATLRTGITGEDLPDDMNVDHLTNNIISDLITEHIISDTNGLSFRLSDSNLIVNGQKQCATVHAKLKKKYFKPKISAICYNYEYAGNI